MEIQSSLFSVARHRIFTAEIVSHIVELWLDYTQTHVARALSTGNEAFNHCPSPYLLSDAVFFVTDL